MYKPAAHLVGADAYQVAENPYVVSQITAAAVEELARRHARKRLAGKVSQVDPEVEKARTEIQELKRNAELKLSQAASEAEKVSADAKVEAADLLERSRNEGFEKGFAEGNKKGYQEGLKKSETEVRSIWQGRLDTWEALLKDTVKEKENYLADKERVLLELAIKIASKILVREVLKKPTDLKNIVKEAVKKASEKGQMIVHMNPQDVAGLLEKEGSEMNALNQIRIVADEKVVRGGIQIESGGETIDAGLDTQLAEIAKGLLQEAFHAE